jgi:ParB family chromosome partitioning protein
MSTAEIATIKQEYRNLPVAQLVESSTNPRRRFDENGLKELAASFQSQGILQPLLVRKLSPEQYEVIAGARRFRAAKIATLETVPVRIVALSDSAVIEAQAIENLQRENIHPMEEAIGFHSLLQMDSPRYDVPTIASRVGKSEAFVYQRLRLIDLVPAVADAFLADRISTGHALLIAKLPPHQQERALGEAFTSVWTNGKNVDIQVPVKQLAHWIERNLLLVLKDAPFNQDDATLSPEAGACTTCPKRTGFNTLLFGDVSLAHDSCSDAVCFSLKVQAHIRQTTEKKPELLQIKSANGAPSNPAVLPRGRYVEIHLPEKKPGNGQGLQPHQKPCRHMKEAIVSEGFDAGTVTKVCADPACPIHHPVDHSRSPESVAKAREQRRKELLKQKLDATVRFRTLAAVLAKTNAPLKRAELQAIAGWILEKLSPNQRELIARRHKLIEGESSEVQYSEMRTKLLRSLRDADEVKLSRLLIESVLLEETETVQAPAVKLMEAAKQHRIDVEKLKTTVEQEFRAKEAKLDAKRKAPAKSVPSIAKKKTA